MARPAVVKPAAVLILAAGQLAALILASADRVAALILPAAEAQRAVTTKILRHAFFKGALKRRTM